MKGQIRAKMKKELANYLDAVYIEEELYAYYKALKNLCKQYGITDKKQVFEKFFYNLSEKGLNNLLEVKDINFDVASSHYSQNEPNEYFRLFCQYKSNNTTSLKITSYKKLITQEDINETIHVEDMQGKRFTYKLASGTFSTPNYGSHYIAFVKHPKGYRIYNSLNHDKTAQLHNLDSLTHLIVKDMNAKNNYRNRTHEQLYLVYKKVAQDNQIQHNAHAEQVAKTKENKQKTTSPPDTQSEFRDQAGPFLALAGMIGLVLFASKIHSKVI
ncbi:MAG: hypothetical protein AAF380_01415 [Bacteroidota bacterium]